MPYVRLTIKPKVRIPTLVPEFRLLTNVQEPNANSDVISWKTKENWCVHTSTQLVT